MSSEDTHVCYSADTDSAKSNPFQLQLQVTIQMCLSLYFKFTEAGRVLSLAKWATLLRIINVFFSLKWLGWSWWLLPKYQRNPSWLFVHLYDESWFSYIFFKNIQFWISFTDNILEFGILVKNYQIFIKNILVSLYMLQMLKIKVIQTDWIIELLLPYCKCHCDRITNSKIMSHRHLLVSELLPLFYCSEYDSYFFLYHF